MRLKIRYTLMSATAVILVINLIIHRNASTSTFTLLSLLSLEGEGEKVDLVRNRHQGRYHNNGTNHRATLDLMPKHLREIAIGGLPVTITAEEFRKHPKMKTGNPLIDTYGENDAFLSGERGRGVTFVDKEKEAAMTLQREFNINVMASDVIPLNRMVPDSRLDGCEKLTYDHDLPTATVVLPFYNEWPSLLLRTVYSLVNRTPRHLLWEILLIDDCSTMAELGKPLDQYLQDFFPRDLVRVLRMPKREGLIRARMEGWKKSNGDVVVFFDSHMEVNIDWLQPLLTEIKKDRRTVPMSVLDYINQDTLEYRFNRGYLNRYGFDWRLVFFETFFRDDQIGPTPQSPRPGAMMVGAAFAIDRKYFGELGGYDTGMKVWGGENLEMAWRVWLCGGRLVHLPCSHLGHVARAQPYIFPEGRRNIEMFNYKRAILVWMEDQHKEFVYNYSPEMKGLDVGDVSDRLALKEKLQCRNFTWYMDNVWPELSVYNQDVQAWGSLVNKASEKCADNHGYLFQAPADLYTDSCHFLYNTQGFSLAKSGLLRTTLQCVVVKEVIIGGRPKLEDCITGPRDQWNHTKEGSLVHLSSKMCLDEDPNGPVMRSCDRNRTSQHWKFTHYVTR
ncbi:polypeptide N-acetylgalactosaminyltransferase 1-like [Littorina saxatilis]|uniref:Polypeptide N-acetylgalactosaminyltransferase n=1 Tax=Littorina saxatilis TaxID=31220 RepID=A0AAN9C2I0_9CAEN